MSPQLYMSMHGLNNLFNINVQLQRLDDINDNEITTTTPQYNFIVFIIYKQHHIIIILIQQMHSYSNSSLGSFIKQFITQIIHVNQSLFETDNIT